MQILSATDGFCLLSYSMKLDPWGEMARSLEALRAAFDDSYGASHGFLPASPASAECQRDTLAGTWGAHPVRDANIAPLSYVFVLFDHLDSLATLFRSPGGLMASHTLARSVLDIAVGPWYLLEPDIGERERVRRHMNVRLESLKEQSQFETGTTRTAIRDHAAERIAHITQAARAQGFEVRREGDRYKPPFLEPKIKTTTALVAEMIAPEEPTLGPLFWRLGSAVAHGQQHGITMFFEHADQQVDPTHGDTAAKFQVSSKDTALRCGGAPLAVIATLRRLFQQYGWDAVQLEGAIADVVNTWQAVAGVQPRKIPATFL